MAWFRMMGADSVDYHRATVLGRSDDHPEVSRRYYGSRGETPLVWGGCVAVRLGLEGAVADDEYDAIFGPGGAIDPHLGDRMVRTRRPGVELVVSAHKSVAVLGVLGAVDYMHAIVDAETDATMGFLDEWFRRQGGRRGRSQYRTATSGLLWARTRHLTTRAGDPEPHDHILVANLTEMLDASGGWKALDTGGLRKPVHAATMVGRLAAAETAVELGYAIEADDGPSGKLGHWRIAGVPDRVMRLFSKRSAQIAIEDDYHGFHTYRSRSISARNSRAPRPEATAPTSTCGSPGVTRCPQPGSTPETSGSASSRSATDETKDHAPSPPPTARPSPPNSSLTTALSPIARPSPAPMSSGPQHPCSTGATAPSSTRSCTKSSATATPSPSLANPVPEAGHGRWHRSSRPRTPSPTRQRAWPVALTPLSVRS